VTLFYNLVMLVLDIAAIWLVCRRGSLTVWCGTMACAGAIALGLAGFLAGCFENHFGFFRFLAYAVFLHGPVLLAASAILWRRTRPVLAGGAAITVLAVLLVAADAFLIEPHWLEVSHWQFSSPKIQHPVRIVVVSDLQTDCVGPYERAVLRQALEEKPDILLLAGDYIQAPGMKRGILDRELRDLLAELSFAAPRGVFAIQGNVDPPYWRKIFEGLDVSTVTASRSFDLGDLRLTCLGLFDSFNAELKIPDGPADQFHLVLGHVPNFALGRFKADLLVAGHTHGGQVRLPWIGPMITHAAVPHTWAAGLTELPGGGRLLVSRGIGMERGYAPPLRFLCRPELVVIELTPEEKGAADEGH
jgi:uncharacterized protein